MPQEYKAIPLSSSIIHSYIGFLLGIIAPIQSNAFVFAYCLYNMMDGWMVRGRQGWNSKSRACREHNRHCHEWESCHHRPDWIGFLRADHHYCGRIHPNHPANPSHTLHVTTKASVATVVYQIGKVRRCRRFLEAPQVNVPVRQIHIPVLKFLLDGMASPSKLALYRRGKRENLRATRCKHFTSMESLLYWQLASCHTCLPKVWQGKSSI
jgi:hypothetical protein